MFSHVVKHQKLDECAMIEKGKMITRDEVIPGSVPVVAAGIEPSCYHSTNNRPAGTITVSASGANAGYVNFWKEPIFASDCNTIVARDANKLDNVFLFCRLKVMQDDIYKMQRGSGQPHVYAKDIAKIDVPIPDLPVQKQYARLVEQSDKSKFIISNRNLSRCFYAKQNII